MKNNAILRGLGCATMLFLAFAPFANAQSLEGKMQITSETQLRAGDEVLERPVSDIRVGGSASGAVTATGSKSGVVTGTVSGETKLRIQAVEDGTNDGSPEVTGEKNNVDDKDVVEIKKDDDADGDLFNIELDIDVEGLMEDEDGDGHHAEGSVEIDDADEVNSSADFEHYVAFKAKSDERIKDVELKDGKVLVTYAMPVKFFGIWRTSMNTTAEVNSTGAVEVRYPWYSVFMRKEFSKNTLEPAFRASLEAHQHANANSAVQATTTETVSAKSYVVPHVFDTVVKTFSEASSAELSYTAKAGKTGKTK